MYGGLIVEKIPCLSLMRFIAPVFFSGRGGSRSLSAQRGKIIPPAFLFYPLYLEGVGVLSGVSGGVLQSMREDFLICVL